MNKIERRTDINYTIKIDEKAVKKAFVATIGGVTAKEIATRAFKMKNFGSSMVGLAAELAIMIYGDKIAAKAGELFEKAREFFSDEDDDKIYDDVDLEDAEDEDWLDKNYKTAYEIKPVYNESVAKTVNLEYEDSKEGEFKKPLKAFIDNLTKELATKYADWINERNGDVETHPDYSNKSEEERDAELLDEFKKEFPTAFGFIDVDTLEPKDMAVIRHVILLELNR